MSKRRGVEGSRTGRQLSTQTRAVSTWVIPLALALLTLAVFYPVLKGKFLNWDDQANLLDSPYYRGLGWAHLRWMFTTFYLGNYRPLTWMTLGFDYILWGVEPRGYHLTSLLLHGANALLFYFIAMRLLSLAFSSGDRLNRSSLRVAAGFAALFFSIHPLRVEPVAWLSARNHLLAALFCLGTILCYLRAAEYHPQGRRGWLIAAVVLYGFSLLSQPSGITLPFVLLVLDFYPLRRLGNGLGKWFGAEVRWVWWEKLPFLFLAMGGGLLALVAKQEGDLPFRQIDAFSWLAQAVYKITFYVSKTIIPIGLSPLYMLPIHLDLWDWSFLLSGAGLVGITIATFVLRHRWPAAFVGWLCYLTIIVPYVFFMPAIEGAENAVQSTADRYSYLSCLPWALFAGAGAFYWLLRLGKRSKFETSFVGVGFAALLVGFMALSWKQAQVWHDSETLWRSALRAGAEPAVAHNNLGTALMDQHRVDEAIEQFKMVLKTNRLDAGAYFNIGLALAQKQNPEGATRNYRMAVRLKPDFHRAIYALSVDLAKKGEFGEAIAQLQQALKFKGRSRTYFNLANIFVMQGRGQDAIYYLRLALQEQPDFAEADDQLGNVLAAQGNLMEALEHLRRAVELDPEWSEAHFDLANGLVRQGNLTEAVQHFEKALQRRPDYVEAHNNLGRVLAAQGNLTGAVEHFRQALRFRPGFVPAQQSLAMALEEQRTPR